MIKLRRKDLYLFLCLTNLSIFAQNENTLFSNVINLEVNYTTFPEVSTCTGEVEIVPLNGVSPYSYSIDAGKTFQKEAFFSGLCAKRYFVHVRDNNGELGIKQVNFSIVSYQPKPQLDLDSLIVVFHNEINVDAKRKIQSQLAIHGVKFPVIITKLPDESYSMPLFRQSSLS